ncbi:MAG: flagellar biosynthesis anti-sigma factor FlgM [Comamonadaceae bacterium 32-67-11]|nr:MAG: flagellar biosynthesis anti-sigma factor FlgM [Comamonadaceae bacterium 32-67-11]
MNVNHLTDKPAAVSPSTRMLDRAAVPAQAVGSTGSATAASVEVRLSAVTQTMTNNVARSGADVFNAEKVQAMRSAIQNGSFSVNAEAIADQVLVRLATPVGARHLRP